jgi:multisubunit Na+/H+ antiporter MnhC subunit
MDLILTVLAFALALIVIFVPLAANILWLLQVLLVILLGVLLLLLFFQGRGRNQKPEAPQPPSKKPAEPRAAAAPTAAPSPDALVEAGVVQFLARLQEKGRLVDFLMDDITPYPNEQVGVVARVVHQGCREVLQGAFEIVPVHQGKEREAVSFAADFDAASYRLVGKVPDRPPYQGTVLHRGWKATRVTLPRITETSGDSAARRVIAPAEVEIG